MKRLIVMCMALCWRLAPAATAEAAKGGKSKGAAKTCVAKKSRQGQEGEEGQEGLRQEGQEGEEGQEGPDRHVRGRRSPKRDCRADRREDPEDFAADFGSGAAALAKCAAELLGEGSGDELLAEDEPPSRRAARERAGRRERRSAPFDARATSPAPNDDELVSNPRPPSTRRGQTPLISGSGVRPGV